MPSFKTEGKSKEDLAIVAQLSGLLTLEETSRMTRSELARVIERENRKLEAAARDTINESAGQKPVRGRKAKPAAEPAVSASIPETPSTDVKSAPVKGRKRVSRKTAEPAEAALTAKPASPTQTETSPAADKSKPTRTKTQKTTAVKTTAVKTGGRTPKKKINEPAEMPLEAVGAQTSESEPMTLTETVADSTPAAVQPALSETSESAKQEANPPAAAGRRRRSRSTAADNAASSPAAADSTLTETADAPEPVEPAAPSAAAAINEPPADTSPEASEAATDKELAASHHVPPHHTLTPARSIQRRTRIIGSPETAEPGRGKGSKTRHDKPAPQERGKPGRPAIRQPEAAEPASLSGLPEMEDTASPAAPADTSAAAAAATQETERKAGHSAAVEAGDIQAGILEIMPDGYGFLRKENYLQGNKDIYVPPQYIRRFGLRQGDHVSGPVKLQRENDRYQALLYIKEVNGMSPEKMIRRPHFDKLTPIYPDERFVLETVRNELSTRIIDLVAPIGKGQRGMIVSPPKAGKTILLQKIANAISVNNPDVKLIVLLIDERPEEVTDMQRSINGEVVYSTFDKTPENHTKVTELVLERAMRLVELKQDVVILLDSMTRLARAYNLSINPTGRTLSGGLDPGALYGPKRFFGAARNIENGGSLTIIATSLIETGSRMDEVIFEEFKGTGNMEVYLDRKMSEKRIFPAIDINKSGTRREELLMSPKELDAVWTIRKAFSQLDTTAVTEAIINLLLKTTNNQHFISSVNVSFNDKNVFEAMRGVRPSDATQSGQQAGGTAGRGNYGTYNSSGYNSSYRRQTANDDD